MAGSPASNAERKTWEVLEGLVEDVYRRPRRYALALCGAAALLGAATTEAAGTSAGQASRVLRGDSTALEAASRSCRGADARAPRARRSRLQSALMCLVNRERAVRGIRPLRRDRRLVRAARRHARDMVRHRYFAHQRSGGPDLGTRLDRAGWRGEAAGETIAYGCEHLGTPRAIVRAWMNSPGHASILLSGSYGRGGPGVAERAPVSCSSGATWVLDVGRL